MTDAISKIKVRINALLAKANGTDNEHEAETFLAKAMDLLQQYQLDVSDLVEKDDPMLDKIGLTVAKSGHAWRWKLYLAVGTLYGCKNVIHSRYDLVKGKWVPVVDIRLVGRESALLTADLMYPWIVEQVRQQGRALAKVTGMSEQGQAKRVAAALIERIYRIHWQNERDAAAPSATRAQSNALVVLKDVDAYHKSKFGELKAIREGKSTTDAASRAAADKIGLHRQVKTAAALQIGGQ